MRKWITKNSAESENLNWILANTKPCPKCHRPIEKNQGCMHMTCSQCRWGGGWTQCLLVCGAYLGVWKVLCRRRGASCVRHLCGRRKARHSCTHTQLPVNVFHPWLLVCVLFWLAYVTGTSLLDRYR